MNPQLDYILAQLGIADRQRAAEHARLATDAGTRRRDSGDSSPVVRALPMPTAHPSPEAWPDPQRAAPAMLLAVAPDHTLTRESKQVQMYPQATVPGDGGHGSAPWIPAWVRIRLMLRSAVIDVHDVVREHDLAIVTPNDAFPPGSSIKPVGTTQLWPVLLDSREDREKHRNVAVVVGVAVDGDEVGDAVLGGKRGVMAFELPVGIREPLEGDYLSEGHAAR